MNFFFHGCRRNQLAAREFTSGVSPRLAFIDDYRKRTPAMQY
jgi:hypothetical protein